MKIRQISNLKKIRQEALENIEQIEAMTAMQGERVSYQVVLENEERVQFRVEVLSPLAEQVKVYLVRADAHSSPRFRESR